MEIANVAVPAVNNHYNSSSNLKAVQWSYLQKSCGLAAKASGEKNIFCVAYYNVDHIRVDFICLCTWNQLQHVSASSVHMPALHVWFIFDQARLCKFAALCSLRVAVGWSLHSLTCEYKAWGWAKAFLA